MSRFHFRLQTVLRLREAERDARRAELAETLQADARLEAQRQALARRRTEVLASEAEARLGKLDLGRLRDAEHFDRGLRERMQALALQRQSLVPEIARRQQAVLAADREVRMLEKLRESRRQEHAQDELRNETRTLDEIALQRHGQEPC